MSTSDQGEPNIESRRPRELETGENTLPAEGYLSFATQRPLQFASQSVERRLVELLATIGHEFRTPLTVINGYTTTLLRRSQQLSSQEHQEFLQIIQRAGLHLEYQLARLFEIAELEAGSLSLEWSLVDLAAVARESIALAQQHVPEPLHDRFTFHVQCRDERGNPTEQVPPIKGDERCGYFYRTWWIIRSNSANILRAGFFFIRSPNRAPHPEVKPHPTSSASTFTDLHTT